MALFLRISAAMAKKGSQPVDRERSLLIDETAELLGISRRSVYYRIRDGRLRTIRTRGGSQRVLLSSIERLLREMRHLPPLPSLARNVPADPGDPGEDEGSEPETLTF